MPPAALVGRYGGAVVLIVAASALSALDGLAVARGPLAPVSQAFRSLAGAQRLARLALSGVLDATTTLRWEDHLLRMIVTADPLAASALADRVLAPLADATPARAALLRETLSAWLRHPGRPQAIAAELHLHPQSVRYRVARLRERFGTALDDPDARLELQIALLARS